MTWQETAHSKWWLDWQKVIAPIIDNSTVDDELKIFHSVCFCSDSNVILKITYQNFGPIVITKIKKLTNVCHELKLGHYYFHDGKVYDCQWNEETEGNFIIYRCIGKRRSRRNSTVTEFSESQMNMGGYHFLCKVSVPV